MVPWLELTLWPMYSWLCDSVWDPFQTGERERSQATFLTTQYVSNILISKSGRIGIWFTMVVQRISSFALQMVVKWWHPKSFLNDWDDHSSENLSIKTLWVLFFLVLLPCELYGDYSNMDRIPNWPGSRLMLILLRMIYIIYWTSRKLNERTSWYLLVV